jgi:hypothetical protein
MPEEPPKLDGEFRGLVRDRDDPEQSGRVKVFVEPIHRGIQTENLPWAIPHQSVVTGGTQDGDDYGSINIPNENTWVVIEFENGRPEQPIYKYEAVNQDQLPDRFQGSQDSVYDDISSNLGDSEPQATVSDYGDVRGFKLKNDIVVEYDDSDNNARILIYHPSGYRDEVLSNGTHVLHSEDDDIEVIAGTKIIENADIRLGTGQIERLVQATIDSKLNNHKHSFVNAHGSQSITDAPIEPILTDADKTDHTRSS